MEKTDPKKSRPSPQALDCINALDQRWRTLKTLTGLLELCSELGRGATVEADLIGKTAFMMSEELQEMEADLDCLTASLQR